MWRCLCLGLVLVVGCRGSRESRVCKQLTKLCGEDKIPDTCASDLVDAKDALGESWDKVASCAGDATSCPEIIGCFAGGVGNAISRWGDQFEKGANKAFGEDKHGGRSGHSTDRDSSAKCKTFRGDAKSARWTDCDDKIIREITCKPFIDDLQCMCRIDGVEHDFFHATDPPIDNRDGATRVAKANCHDDAFDNL